MPTAYFASDFHLGVPSWHKARAREERVNRWLDMISRDLELEELYLVGDIFDFWFEYKTVVPKGFVRFLGRLAALSDRGVQLHLFTGNHDTWMFDYFEKELNAQIHHQPIQMGLGDKQFFVGHGDGLGPGDRSYKIIKRIFRNRFCQWLFRWIHPDWGVRLANFFSHSSRNAQKGKGEHEFLGKDKEWLILYSERKMKELPEVDYFIFGHRHLAQDLLLSNEKSRYINLGDWFSQSTYAVFDGEELSLKYFEPIDGQSETMATQPIEDSPLSSEL